jgi:nitrogen regulatory protein PII
MQLAKKIEIVTVSVEVVRLCHALDEQGVSGYTVVEDVVGKGHRGRRRGDELTNVFKNSYIFTVVTPELVEPIVEAVRPILQRYGGVCLVSDVQSIGH